MHAFWKGLNKFRLSKYGEVFRLEGKTPKNHYNFFLTEDKSLLGYVIANKIMVLINVGIDSKTIKDINVPEGRWKMIGNNEKVDHKNFKKGRQELIKGGIQNFVLEGKSLMIYVNQH